MATITTATLNLYRNDWAKAEDVAGRSEDINLRLWNLLQATGGQQRDELVKGNTGLGYADVAFEGSPNPVKAPIELNELRLSQKRRGIAWHWTYEAQQFDMYNKMRSMAVDAKNAIQRRKQLDAADLVLNDAFSVNIATGAPLYSNSHSIAGTTFDNLASAAALSEAAVADLLVMLRKQRGPKNEPMGYGGKVLLVVPSDLEFIALKIANSHLVPGVADNDRNVVASRLEVHVETEATSSTAYAMIAQNRHHLHKSVRKDMDSLADKDTDGNIKFSKMALYAVGAVLPYYVAGNPGA